ncbi:hypothetical protein [Vibrio ziniensis]|uniref:DUF998 domain-containing protein n=1 Tax=Vibrio ziniensis TaxID=2711221 RepID=A0A6G7CPS9_9VIBR|nr:hypothetical protein [Vibrio ziniensis]QIH44115.1 hypothetical protein G5S32_19300 [Vibrio ziniensis]
MNIKLNPQSILTTFLFVIGLLVIANLFGIYARFNLDFPHIQSVIRLVDVDTEMNVPTLYSSFAMFVASALLALVGYMHRLRKESSFPWFGLAFIFTFLSIDESSEFHEMLVGPVRDTLHTSGVFYFAWVIPYGLLAIVLGIAYFRFLLNLPRNILGLYVLSGCVFLAGALGLELIGGVIAQQSGTDSFIYAMSYTCEETLEMVGIALLIYTTARYIVQVFPGTQIEFVKSK